MAQVKLLDFWASWCQPCKIMTPIVKEIEAELKGEDVEFKEVNVDENSELAAKYGVMSIPTFIVEVDGKEVGRKVGVTSKTELLKLLNQ